MGNMKDVIQTFEFSGLAQQQRMKLNEAYE
jgi:hypothetical protein